MIHAAENGRQGLPTQDRALPYPQTQDGRINRMRQLEKGRFDRMSLRIQGSETGDQEIERHHMEHDQGRLLYEIIANNGLEGAPVPIAINFQQYPGERITSVSKNELFARFGEAGKSGSLTARIKLSRIRIPGTINDSLDAHAFLNDNLPLTIYSKPKESFLNQTFAELKEVTKLLHPKPLPVDPVRKRDLEATEMELLTQRVMRFFQGNEGDEMCFTEFAIEHDPETDQALAMFFLYRYGELRDTYATSTPFTTRDKSTTEPMKRALIDLFDQQK